MSYAKAQVEVQERLDGSLVVAYQGAVVASQPAPLDAPVLRARRGRVTQPVTVVPVADPLQEERREELAGVGVDAGRRPHGGAPPPTPCSPKPDHPWRRGYKLPGDKVTEPSP